MSDDKADNVMTPEELVRYYLAHEANSKHPVPYGVMHGIEEAVKTIESAWNRCLREYGPIDAVARFSVTLHQLQREINGGGDE